MPVPEPAWTLGVEEEYLLVDTATGALVTDAPPTLFERSQAKLEGQVSPEFLRSQIEVGTRVCANIGEATEELRWLRRTVCETAEEHGLSVVAASTHPFAKWREQKHTDAERYNILARDMQAVMRRLVICGMHVHVGIADPDMRIDLMNQVSYFLPHILAISTSSPFWAGLDTGLKSYRKSVFKSAPRTGLPEQFSSWGEYERHVNVLVDAGIIENASKIWWDVRPSATYPTVEMRIADVPTRLDDSIAIAALYVCLMRMLWRKRTENQRWRSYVNLLVEENVWRAQRYGVHESLIDFGKGETVPFIDLAKEIVELVADDAIALGCEAEVAHVVTIAERGTSADTQLKVYEDAIRGGADEEEALRLVVVRLIEETKAGL